jgi:small subunit ribosomal protein S16
MVKLRLKQLGKKNDRRYRVVASDSRNKRGGAVLENLGSYNPIPNKSEILINVEAMDKWIANGAQMTERVAKLYTLAKNNKIEK